MIPISITIGNDTALVILEMFTDPNTAITFPNAKRYSAKVSKEIESLHSLGFFTFEDGLGMRLSKEVIGSNDGSMLFKEVIVRSGYPDSVSLTLNGLNIIFENVPIALLACSRNPRNKRMTILLRLEKDRLQIP